MRRLTSLFAITLALCLSGLSTSLEAQQKKLTSGAIPAGTGIQVRLGTPLDSGEAKAGQAFTGTIAEPVVVGGKTVLAKGATVKGKVTEAVSSGRLKRPASLTLVLTSVSTDPLKIDGKSHLLRNVALIGGGTGAGAIVGGATGGKKGAAIGAAIGAGAGAAAAYMTGKNEIALPAEMVLPFVAGSGAAASASTASVRTAAAGEALRGNEPAGRTTSVAKIAEVIFTDRDRQMIQSYYSGGKGLPPGLAKRGGNLPPGLEKQLRRNGTLPPGLQKKVEPFPVDLSRKLSPLPEGYSRAILAGRALILDRNHKILDLLAITR